jgi:hypothetical protein
LILPDDYFHPGHLGNLFLKGLDDYLREALFQPFPGKRIGGGDNGNAVTNLHQLRGFEPCGSRIVILFDGREKGLPHPVFFRGHPSRPIRFTLTLRAYSIPPTGPLQGERKPETGTRG